MSKRFERRGELVVSETFAGGFGLRYTCSANLIIDTACEVLNGIENGNLDNALLEAFTAALTEAGCIQEVKPERYYYEEAALGQRIVDGRDPDKSYLTTQGIVAELNRLSELAGER